LGLPGLFRLGRFTFGSGFRCALFALGLRLGLSRLPLPLGLGVRLRLAGFGVGGFARLLRLQLRGAALSLLALLLAFRVRFRPLARGLRAGLLLLGARLGLRLRLFSLRILHLTRPLSVRGFGLASALGLGLVGLLFGSRLLPLFAIGLLGFLACGVGLDLLALRLRVSGFSIALSLQFCLSALGCLALLLAFRIGLSRLLLMAGLGVRLLTRGLFPLRLRLSLLGSLLPLRLSTGLLPLCLRVGLRSRPLRLRLCPLRIASLLGLRFQAGLLLALLALRVRALSGKALLLDAFGLSPALRIGTGLGLLALGLSSGLIAFRVRLGRLRGLLPLRFGGLPSRFGLRGVALTLRLGALLGLLSVALLLRFRTLPVRFHFRGLCLPQGFGFRLRLAGFGVGGFARLLSFGGGSLCCALALLFCGFRGRFGALPLVLGFCLSVQARLFSSRSVLLGFQLCLPALRLGALLGFLSFHLLGVNLLLVFGLCGLRCALATSVLALPLGFGAGLLLLSLDLSRGLLLLGFQLRLAALGGFAFLLALPLGLRLRLGLLGVLLGRAALLLHPRLRTLGCLLLFGFSGLARRFCSSLLLFAFELSGQPVALGLRVRLLAFGLCGLRLLLPRSFFALACRLGSSGGLPLLGFRTLALLLSPQLCLPALRLSLLSFVLGFRFGFGLLLLGVRLGLRLRLFSLRILHLTRPLSVRGFGLASALGLELDGFLVAFSFSLRRQPCLFSALGFLLSFCGFGLHLLLSFSFFALARGVGTSGLSSLPGFC